MSEDKKTISAEDQKLIDLALEEAETKANDIVAKAKEEAENIITSAKISDKKLKNAKYICLMRIREDGKYIEEGEAYSGKYAKRLLASKAIKKN